MWSPISGRYNEIIGDPESYQPEYDNTNWLNGRRNIQAEPIADVHELTPIAFNESFTDNDNEPF